MDLVNLPTIIVLSIALYVQRARVLKLLPRCVLIVGQENPSVVSVRTLAMTALLVSRKTGTVPLLVTVVHLVNFRHRERRNV